MSKTYEVRVRPVVRYNVTVFQGGTDEHGSYGSCETVGEFANEGNAEKVAEALRKANEPITGNNRFVVIREGDFTPETVAYYASDEAEAKALAARLYGETGHGWRIAVRLQ